MLEVATTSEPTTTTCTTPQSQTTTNSDVSVCPSSAGELHAHAHIQHTIMTVTELT